MIRLLTLFHRHLRNLRPFVSIRVSGAGVGLKGPKT